MRARTRRGWCRVFGHRHPWFVDDPARPDDLTVGCTRCKDPSTFRTLVQVESDPSNPDVVRIGGLDRLEGFLEGKR